MLKIRKYKEEDKEQVKELIESILWEIFNKEPRKLEDLNNIKSNYGLFLVAEDDGKIVGTAGIMNKNNLSILRRVFVKKEYRKKGIAQKLYDKIEDYCKRFKLKSIVLSTSDKMKAAIKFYEENGFVIKKIKEDKIFMEKVLV